MTDVEYGVYFVPSRARDFKHEVESRCNDRAKDGWRLISAQTMQVDADMGLFLIFEKQSAT
jgi:hypothetical protein